MHIDCCHNHNSNFVRSPGPSLVTDVPRSLACPSPPGPALQLVFLDTGLPEALAVLGCRGSSVVRQGGWGRVMTKWGVRIHRNGGHRRTK